MVDMTDAELEALIDAVAAESEQKRVLDCRRHELTVAQLSLTKPVYLAAGAGEAAVDAFIAALKLAPVGSCNADEPLVVLIGSMRQNAQSFIQMVKDVATNLGVDESLAVDLLAQLHADALGSARAECGQESDAALNEFLLQGVLPPGLESLSGLLFTGCSSQRVGSVFSRNAEGLAEALVSGNGMAGSFRACLNNVLEHELDDNQCNDPRADGDGEVSDSAPDCSGQVMGDGRCVNSSSECADAYPPGEGRQKCEESFGGGSGDGNDEDDNDGPTRDDPEWSPYGTGVEQEDIQRCERMGGGADVVSACVDNAQWNRRRELEERDAEATRQAEAGCSNAKCMAAVEILSQPNVHSAQEVAAAAEAKDTIVFVANWFEAGPSNGNWFLDTVSFVKTTVENVFGFPTTGTYAGIVLDGIHGQAYGESERLLREHCKDAGDYEKCQGLDKLGPGKQQRCLGDTLAGQPVSYMTPDRNGQLRGANGFQAFDACYCDHLGTPLFGADCLTPEQRLAQKCLVDPPPGDDDGGTWECRQFIRSATLSPDALLAAHCHETMPDPDCVLIDRNGECRCYRDLPEGDLDQLMNEEICGKVMCDPRGQTGQGLMLDLRTGCCQEYAPPPTTPLPQGPTCIQSPSRPEFLFNPLDEALIDAHLPTIDTLDTLGVRTRLETTRDITFFREGYTNAIGPLVTRESFPDLIDRGTLKLEILQAPSQCASQRVEVRCTSDVRDTFALGSVDLTSVSASAFGEVDIPIDTTALDDCLLHDGSASRLSFVTESCDLGTPRLALGDFTIVRPDTQWQPRLPLDICPGNPTALRTTFELSTSETTTAAFNILVTPEESDGSEADDPIVTFKPAPSDSTTSALPDLEPEGDATDDSELPAPPVADTSDTSSAPATATSTSTSAETAPPAASTTSVEEPDTAPTSEPDTTFPSTWACAGPSGFEDYPGQFYGDGACDCGCGAVDVDCDSTQATACAYNYCTNSEPAPNNNAECL